MTKIQGKSILVRVSARFELARVRVIGSRLQSHIPTILLLGLQALLFKKRFPAKTETWLISSHLYKKCTYTALKLRETVSKITDALQTQCNQFHILLFIFKLAFLALFFIEHPFLLVTRKVSLNCSQETITCHSLNIFSVFWGQENAPLVTSLQSSCYMTHIFLHYVCDVLYFLAIYLTSNIH